MGFRLRLLLYSCYSALFHFIAQLKSSAIRELEVLNNVMRRATNFIENRDIPIKFSGIKFSLFADPNPSLIIPQDIFSLIEQQLEDAPVLVSPPPTPLAPPSTVFAPAQVELINSKLQNIWQHIVKDPVRQSMISNFYTKYSLTPPPGGISIGSFRTDLKQLIENLHGYHKAPFSRPATTTKMLINLYILLFKEDFQL
jgi:hypothetical protein